MIRRIISTLFPSLARTPAELPPGEYRAYLTTHRIAAPPQAWVSTDFEAGFLKCGEILANEFSGHPKCQTAYQKTMTIIAHRKLKNESIQK